MSYLLLKNTSISTFLFWREIQKCCFIKKKLCNLSHDNCMINIIPINNLQPYLFFRNYKFLCFLTTQSITKSVSFVLSSDFAATAAASANPLSLTGLGSLNALSGFQPYPAGKITITLLFV